MKHVLFVCTGNSCRSPMAEALFRNHVAGNPDYIVGSAGVSAADGQPASDHTTGILNELGIDLSEHRSRSLTADIVDRATHIVAMTWGHRQAIETLFPHAADKTYLACEFLADDNLRGADIPDPIGLGRRAYETTRDILQLSVPTIFQFIEQTTMTTTAEPAPASTTGQATSASITIGADHGGVVLKDAIVAHLKSKGITVADVGTNGSESVDYPDYAQRVASAVLDDTSTAGILCCTSGIGMSIAANRFAGIQAAVVFDPADATTTRQHNNANIICLSGS
ncbi:MAG: RpiB/LacA/LacB family sugar-phosphate isomerase, partial [Verrucomicrobiales bacterium]|nr:RpiB/LacA/LacB family sugar-phosphate isomerase [Verrucomicrobiales bacterium]